MEALVLQTMPKYLLALDQSSKITGWAVFDQDAKTLLTYDKFSLTDDDLGVRLHQFRNKISELISEYNISFVVFENIQLQGNVANNVQTFKALAEVYGVLHELCISLDIPCDQVLAGTWKASLGIRGRARAEQKRNAQIFVENTYTLKPTQDECDALCIGTHYINQNKTSAW